MKARALLAVLVPVLVLVAGAAAALPVDVEGWSVVNSPNLVIFTDAGVERGVEIAVDLERFRAVFAQLAPALELEAPAPTSIFAFRDGESYAPYKTHRGARRAKGLVLGQFVSHADGNYLTLDADPGHVGATAVLYHEYVHYFVRTNFPRVPLWFNEGLAEYYSTFETDGVSAFLGRPVRRHLDWLRRHGRFDLSRVLAASSADHHAGGEAGELYAVSWLLVHHLLSGGTERLDQTADYLARVGAGDDPDDAFATAFGISPRALEQPLLDAAHRGDLAAARIPLETLPPVSVSVEAMAPAEVLARLGDLLAHLGRPSQAERHFQAALDRDAEHAGAHAGLALVRDQQGRIAEAELLYRDALRLGTEDPLTYLLYGRHVLMSLDHDAGDAADTVGSPRATVDRRAALARDLFRRVVELAPHFAEGHAMLGYAHLFGDLDSGAAAAGIASLRRAVERVPGRDDRVFALVQLHLRAAQPEQAERWVEGVLAPRADPELVTRAREAVERWRLVHAAEAALAEGEVETGLALFDRAISVTSDPDLRARMAETLLALRARQAED